MTRREGVGHVPPLFSVIIPTYNRPDLLRCAVESVLTQTVQDLELTVVGDGSPTPVQIGDRAGARRSLLRSVRLRPSLRTPKQLVATFPRPFGRD